MLNKGWTVTLAGIGINLALGVLYTWSVIKKAGHYGACLSVFPSAVKDNFGLKNFGINYGLVFTAWGVGGFVFPLFAGKLFEAAKTATGTGSYNDAYLTAAGVLVLAAGLTFATRAVEQRHKSRFAGQVTQ